MMSLRLTRCQLLYAFSCGLHFVRRPV